MERSTIDLMALPDPKRPLSCSGMVKVHPRRDSGQKRAWILGQRVEVKIVNGNSNVLGTFH
jgi:hypothetical protein